MATQSAQDVMGLPIFGIDGLLRAARKATGKIYGVSVKQGVLTLNLIEYEGHYTKEIAVARGADAIRAFLTKAKIGEPA